MQPKIVMIIVGLFIVGLAIFNVVNSRSSQPAAPEAAAATANSASNGERIIDKPLGLQPKAIVDKATTQYDAAQKLEADKMAQLDEVK